MRQQDENTTSTGEPPQGSRRRGRHGFFGGLFLGSVVGAILAASIGAYAQFDGHRGTRFAGLNSEFAAERAEFAIGMVLGSIDATETQQDQVTSIVQAAIADLQSTVAEHGGTHEAMRDILAQPYIDRAALEQLRANAVLQADTTSQRLVQAIADAAEILTVEQRVQLIEFRRQMRQ